MQVQEVIKKVDAQQPMGYVHDSALNVHYVVLNTPKNEINMEFLMEFHRILD